jgi:signal transduction histidine kinase
MNVSLQPPTAYSPRWLPRTVAARLYLILFSGLLLAHGLSFGLLFYERYEAATTMLMTNIQQDVVVAVNMLDHLPPPDRPQWLPLLRRRTFRYLLGPGHSNHRQLIGRTARDMSQRIAVALGPRYPISVGTVTTEPERFEVHMQLSDGSPLTIDVQPSVMPLAKWLPYVLISQLVLLLVCTWVAVRLAIRPLEGLADAAKALDPGGGGKRLHEGGPAEVANAIAAFNAMQDRIAAYTHDRLRILAAISHDLQTPITRMHLRLEAMGESPERDRMLDDLGQMQHLVREGIAYARSAHGAEEPPLRVDLNAFLESLAYDYVDIGKQVAFTHHQAAIITTRPQALRRVLSNLLDNAINYAGAADLAVGVDDVGDVLIRVLDRGPGIPEAELAQVMEPFYRIETSRNRNTGGTGLGLAIAQQLTESIGAKLQLRNRTDGTGLEAIVYLRADHPADG